MSQNLNNQVKTATKWSAITEIVAKVINPITSMVLARLLTPDAFGIVATITMVISFVEIFTDAGFQKYLIQHQFKDEEDRIQSSNVAFWSNLVLSLFLWGIIAIFNSYLANIVGNPGLGYVLIIACAAIPLAAFSSIQVALYKRDFDYKTLFKVRTISVFIPLLITIPLAFFLRSFWALVIGSLVQNLVNAVLLTVYSTWKPTLYYSFSKLKEMFSFTVWSMIEAISIWLTCNVDIFIVGTMLNQYYLGLYKISSTIVSQIMALITSITTPILFSALSRLQDDELEFKKMFFKFQKVVGLLVIPMGVGIFFYSDLITVILLGKQWMEASGFVGLWGLTSSLTIVLSHYVSEIYRAKGKPRLSVLAQLLHIVVLWPIVYFSVQYGFKVLYISRSLVRLELVLVNLIILYYVIKISPIKMLKNIGPSLIGSIVMGCIAFIFQQYNLSIFWQLVSIGVCIIVYLCVMLIFPKERKIIYNFIKNIKIKMVN